MQAIPLAGPSLRNYFKTVMLSREAAKHLCLCSERPQALRTLRMTTPYRASARLVLR